jgi:predicted alpha/beta superfamily hydrolase
MGSTPPGPPPPYSGKTIFYYSGWSNVSLYYSNNVTGWTNAPMIAIGPGRGGSEQIWRASNVDIAGDTNLQFGFYSVIAGTNSYDNAGRPGLDYQSPLDALVVQDGQVYNYWPPPSVGTNQVVTFQITPTNGLASRTVRVYLPRGYDENTTKRYPVLYMHDGENLFLGMTGLSGYSWSADTNAANLVRFGKMRETIIVGVDSSSDRYCEYAPPTCPYAECTSPVGDQYASLLADQLKPYIDNTYSITAGRTLTGPDDTGILGSSLGGLISGYIGWQRSGTYHKVGTMSSSYWVCYPITSTTNQPIRIYLDSGDMDAQGTVGSCDSLLNTVQERDDLIIDGHVFNIDLDHTIGYGHWHSEQWWAVRLPRCYLFLFPTSDEPDTVLDAAAPPRITNFQLMGPSNVVTWTAYKARLYSLQGSTNQEYSSSMDWSNVFTTPAPEPLPWDYVTGSATNTFQFFRVLEYGVPNWPN